MPLLLLLSAFMCVGVSMGACVCVCVCMFVCVCLYIYVCNISPLERQDRFDIISMLAL